MACVLKSFDELLNNLEDEITIIPVKKPDDLKTRAIYPVPAYTTILDGLVLGPIEEKLNDYYNPIVLPEDE